MEPLRPYGTEGILHKNDKWLRQQLDDSRARAIRPLSGTPKHDINNHFAMDPPEGQS